MQLMQRFIDRPGHVGQKRLQRTRRFIGGVTSDIWRIEKRGLQQGGTVEAVHLGATTDIAAVRDAGLVLSRSRAM